ncbi:MAG: S-methyl-5-thioribose-1-phosphate isomerase [Corynebacterium sp.]|uniref:S-methyl-5-thioribose-1-phosphate isomerase n=1 Tax=Corynebacterium sp. TaxID=1720 RepID=UPI0026DCFA59|nr:S-methyl-5-thioribose-1-phosphate isomerase [Corynebacterium sp.]MDO5099666.1 S-methyl-5-thioribose-1-phosphate isomerase [Corynebacterium sp.]
MFKAIEWVESPQVAIRLLDQTALPSVEKYIDIIETASLVDAIQRLVVRGAPALGASGAYGVALAMAEAKRNDWSEAQLHEAIQSVRDARPTAVNLAWGVDQVRDLVPDGIDAVLTAAHLIAEADVANNKKLSELGADWILEKTGKDKVRVITHCNTGGLATVGWGTALGIIRELHDRGALEIVYADETRPLLQGARLTSWELKQLGIDHFVEADGAASSTILRGLVDVAIIGADRITANGDTANKVGSVALALACQRAGIPFVVAAPASTVDLDTATGDGIHIELRTDSEVHEFQGVRATPDSVKGFNPAFDVTPFDLISAIATENGVAEPATANDPRVMETVVTR